MNSQDQTQVLLLVELRGTEFTISWESLKIEMTGGLLSSTVSTPSTCGGRLPVSQGPPGGVFNPNGMLALRKETNGFL